jgi:Gpi18-like mannosyltransferase
MMNVLFALMTAFLAYLTSRKLNYKAPWMVILFVIFAPIYTVLALSGNIEIMAGLITISSVYFYSRDKFITGNIILSFGFFVRNELFIFIPFFLIYSILQKKYREIPFLLTGFVLYSIAGYFYYHDIFWVITQIPYGDTKGLIETGSLYIM